MSGTGFVRGLGKEVDGGRVGTPQAVGAFETDSARTKGALELLDALDIAILQMDETLRRASLVLGPVERLLGVDRQRWQRDESVFAERVPAEEVRALRRIVDDVLDHGGERTLAHRFATGHGPPRWFRTTVRPVTGPPDGRPQVALVMLDITERRAAEDLLSKADPRLRLVLEQLPAIVWTVDQSMRYTSGLGGGLSTMGIPADATLAGIGIEEHLGTGSHLAAHRRALAGEAVTFETNWQGRTYVSHIEPFRDDKHVIVGAIGVALDVTERRQAEQARDRLLLAERQARREAERAVQLRDEFLSIASHELRTPLTSLHLIVQSLLRGMEQNRRSMSPESLRLADKQCHRLRKLIEQLLDVSSIQSGELELVLEEVDLSAVIAENLARLRGELEESGTAVHVEVTTPVVGFWDAGRIDQLVANLVGNAIKYGRAQPVDVLVDVPQTGWARLRVRDRGIGIAAEDVSRLFQRFGRAVSPRNYGGLGLGLFIARRIAEAHGGTIRVESEAARGSTFTVELPLCGPAGRSEAKAGEQVEQGDRA